MYFTMRISEISGFVCRYMSQHRKPLKSSTIYALSSGHGRCGVAVIRVSGSNAGVALKSMLNRDVLPTPRKALLKKIRHPFTREVLDKGLVLWFPGPHSFTGEDCCEFHVHGGPAVITSVLDALGSIESLRPAEPGEFTRQAFYSGKLDLTEVEGLADLLHAETEAQRKQAFLQLDGALSNMYDNWRTSLLKTVAHLEAYIDFDETETLDMDLLNSVTRAVEELCVEIKTHLNDNHRGEKLRNGVQTVILGEPNVGKSSLFNILCKRPAAIVTPIEGTTRDVLQVTLDINGYPLVLTDTAGLRSKTNDIVEQEGINRARKCVDNADLIILLIDSDKYINENKNITNYLKEYITKTGLENLFSFSNTEINCNKPFLLVFNKTDLLKPNHLETIKKEINVCDNSTLISCESKYGFDKFTLEITEKLRDLCGTPTKEHPSVSQNRHRVHLNQCVFHLEKFLNDTNVDFSIKTQNIRNALRSLGQITGAVTVENVLDVIFKDFCIGK